MERKPKPAIEQGKSRSLSNEELETRERLRRLRRKDSVFDRNLGEAVCQHWIKGLLGLLFVVGVICTLGTSMAYKNSRARAPYKESTCIFGKIPPFAERDDVSLLSQVIQMSELLEEVKSPYQLIQVYRSPFFGNVLVIDGALMTTDRDERHYHEMIAHVPLNYLPEAKKVLIIGGGDGGTLHQVLLHPNVQEATMVDIDSEVIRLSRKHMSTGKTSFDHERATVLFTDGREFVRGYNTTASGHFDVILVDSTDFGQAVSLFSDEFYRTCKTLLHPDHGIFVFNIDTPSWHLPKVGEASRKMNAMYKHAYVYQLQVPSYLSGHYSFMFASDTVHPVKTKVDWVAYQDKGIDAHYYNEDLHYTSFALPNFVKKAIFQHPKMSDVPNWN